MLHMLYSHNTLKKVSVQNRKEETAMNSLREVSPCYLHLPRESTTWIGDVWEDRRGTGCVCYSMGNPIRRALVAF